jgi:hypothetical protein
MDGRVSIRAHYERFPATIKGAFVLRGEDADPHQVRLEEARVAEMAGRSRHAIAIDPMTLDVAPHLDLFVPFEVPLLDLVPGWYRLELDVAVDGDEGVVSPGDRFAVAWPRGSMRRSSTPVGRTIGAGGSSLTVKQVECAPDSVRLTYESPGRVTLSLEADGTPLPQIDETFDPASGTGTVVTYPAAKAQSRITVTARGGERPLEIDLP